MAINQITKVFSGGIGQDLTPLATPQDMAFNIVNMTSTSQDGNTLGAIENIKGNEKVVVNRDIGKQDLETLDVDYTNILGYANIDKYLIIFHRYTTANPTVTAMDRIERLEKVSDLVYNSVTIAAGNFNWFNVKDIKTEVIIEASSLKKVYFIDGVNQLRCLNVDEFNIDSFLPVNYVNTKYDVIRKTSLVEPMILKETVGNIPVGKVQYSYRLYREAGTYSTYSPVSSLYTLVKSTASITSDLKGTATGLTFEENSSKKGLQLSIYVTALDLMVYNNIEIYALHVTTSSSTPTVNLIETRKLNYNIDGLTVTITDEGYTYGSSVVDYSTLIETNNRLVPQTMASKDDRLFIGNINEPLFTIDDSCTWTGKTTSYWDSRVLRFAKNTPTTIITTSNGTWTRVEDSSTVDKLHDFIQLFYDPDYVPTPVCDNGTIFKKNSATLGASGINIDLEFNMNTAYKIGSIGGVNDYTLNTIIEPYDMVSSLTHINGHFYNIESNYNWLLGNKRTFMPREVYRFYITFKDPYGNNIPSKWIGDIQIPEIGQDSIVPLYINADYKHVIVDSATNTLYAVPIIPVFTVKNIPTYEGIPLSYEISFVKRTSTEQSVTGIGLLDMASRWLLSDTYEFATVPVSYNGSGYSENSPSSQGLLREDNDSANFKGLRMPDNTQYSRVASTTSVEATYLNNSNFNKIRLANVIKGVSYYKTNPPGSDTFLNGTALVANEDFQIIRKLYDIEQTCNTYIDSSMLVRSTNYNIPVLNKTLLTANSSFFTKPFSIGTKSLYNVVNNSHGKAGHKGTSVVFNIEDRLSTYNFKNFLISTLDENALVDSRYFIMVYLINDILQYGGGSYNSKTTQTTLVKASSLNSGVCYGDCHIVWADYLRTMWESANDSPATGLQEVIYYPTISMINTFLDNSNFKLSRVIRDASVNSSYLIREQSGDYSENTVSVTQSQNYYDYNTVFSKVNDNIPIVIETIDLYKESNNTTKIMYSDLKLNKNYYDTWFRFKANNYKELTQTYGSINHIVEFRNQLYTLQENAVAILNVNTMAAQGTTVGSTVILGKGDVLGEANYFSTFIGSSKQLPIKTPSSFIFYDGNRCKLYKVATDGVESLSDTKQLSGYFRNILKPTTELRGTYDPLYSVTYLTVDNNLMDHLFIVVDVNVVTKNIIIRGYVANLMYLNNNFLHNNLTISFKVGNLEKRGTIVGIDPTYLILNVNDLTNITPDLTIIDLSKYVRYKRNNTFLYNEGKQVFSSTLSIIPDRYIKTYTELITYKDLKLYRHNESNYCKFYNAYEDSILEFIIPSPTKNAIEFDSYAIDGSVKTNNTLLNETFNTIEVGNSNQVSEEVELRPMADYHTGQLHTDLRQVLDAEGKDIRRYDSYVSGPTLYNIRNFKNLWVASIPLGLQELYKAVPYVTGTYKYGDTVMVMSNSDYNCFRSMIPNNTTPIVTTGNYPSDIKNINNIVVWKWIEISTPLVDNYLFVRFVFKNSDNKQLVVNSITFN